MTRRSRPLAAAVFAVAVLCGGGCQSFFPPAAGTINAPAKTPLQQQQDAVDAAKERFGLAMDVITPLVEQNVLTDVPTLKVIRAAVKQVDADLEDAQASLKAGQLVTAQFLTDRIIGAVSTLEKVRDANKGKGAGK